MLDSFRELLDALVETPTKFQDAAERAGDPPPGEWGAAQVMAHMAAAEQLYLGRLNQLMRERDPLLRKPGQAYEEDQQRLMDSSLEDNVATFGARRGETITLLMGLSLRDWEKTGTHEVRGELSIADLVEDMVDHDAEHLQQLQALST